MTEAVGNTHAAGEDPNRPYTPSWGDRHQAWVRRLPVPAWLYYAAVALALLLLQATVLWGEGAYPIGTLSPAHATIAVLMPLFLALAHFLDDKAAAALVELRPALTTSDQEVDRLCYQLTTLPARPALLASLGGLAFILIMYLVTGGSASFGAFSLFTLSRALLYGTYVLVWWFIAAFVYHTVHQLRTVHLIYTRHTRANLFQMHPLYGLSGLTALTGAGLATILYGWLLINPGLLGEPVALAIVVPLTLLALTTFLWPQLGIHRLLVEEKERLLGDCGARLETALDELHRRVDGQVLQDMDDLHKTIASLELERALLDRVPTWPWRPETVRLLITALALPLGLWLVQYLLERLLGP